MYNTVLSLFPCSHSDQHVDIRLRGCVVFFLAEQCNALALNIQCHSITLILCDVQSQQEHFSGTLKNGKYGDGETKTAQKMNRL